MSRRAAGRYGEYKPSDLQWVGSVPAHWRVERLKFTARGCFNGTWGSEADGGEDDVPCVRVADFDRVKFVVSNEVPTLRCVTKSERRRRELRRGDLLLEKSGRGENQPVGAVVLFDSDSTCVSSNFIARLPIADGFDSRYLTYLHAALYAARINERSIKQTTGIQNLDSESYLSERIPIPPWAEQRHIAAFLDREVDRIDVLIEKKRRLIELLRERLQAVISRAVSMGLDSTVPMRISGVTGLPLVPAHWKVEKCKRYATVLAGFAFPSSGFSSDELHPRLLRGVNVGVGEINWDDAVYWRREPNDGFDRFELSDGTIVLGMDRPLIGGGIRVARVCPQDLPCLLLQRVAAVSTRAELSADFLYHVLCSERFADYFIPELTGVSVPHISPEQILGFQVPIPPLGEQAEIVAVLKEETAKVDSSLSLNEASIDLLRERRSALISAAVTGQIDVREAA